MDYMTFNGWLIETHDMGERSAQDVVSRCKRVCRMLRIDRITPDTSSELVNNADFNNSSMYIKSQLKRAVTLWLDFEGIRSKA